MGEIKYPFWDFIEKEFKADRQHLDFGEVYYFLYLFRYALIFASAILTIWILCMFFYSWIDKKKSKTTSGFVTIIEKSFLGTNSDYWYFIIAKDDKGKHYELKSHVEKYFDYNTGDRIKIESRIGGLTGDTLSIKIVE